MQGARSVMEGARNVTQGANLIICNCCRGVEHNVAAQTVKHRLIQPTLFSTFMYYLFTKLRRMGLYGLHPVMYLIVT
jgi:hypothetical protein